MSHGVGDSLAQHRAREAVQLVAPHSELGHLEAEFAQDEVRGPFDLVLEWSSEFLAPVVVHPFVAIAEHLYIGFASERGIRVVD